MSSVSEIFKQYRDMLSVSRPIFKLSMRENEVTAKLDESAKFTLPHAKDGDAIAHLVNSMFEEHFNKESRSFAFSQVSDDTYLQQIRRSIARFILKNAPFKNPKQSKLYRFFNYSEIFDFNETHKLFLVHVYKYMYPHVDNDSKILSNTSPHLSNILAILEAFEEKYGKEKSFSKRRYR